MIVGGPLVRSSDVFDGLFSMYVVFAATDVLMSDHVLSDIQ